MITYVTLEIVAQFISKELTLNIIQKYFRIFHFLTVFMDLIWLRLDFLTKIAVTFGHF